MLANGDRRLTPKLATVPLQSGDALDRVHEDGRGGEVVADRELAAGEDGPAGDAELVIARLTLPDAPGRVGVNRRALAARAERRAAIVGKADGRECLVCLVVAQTKDGR